MNNTTTCNAFRALISPKQHGTDVLRDADSLLPLGEGKPFARHCLAV